MSQRNWVTLRKRADFLRLQQGQKWVTPGFIIQVLPCPDVSVPVEIGFTATKRLGNAVIRNRCKRRLRALCDSEVPKNQITGYQFVLIARPDAATREFNTLCKDLRWAWRKLEIETQQKIAA